MSLIPIMRLALIFFGSKLWLMNLMHFTRLILGTWAWPLCLLESLQSVVNGCKRSRLGLMDPLNVTRLAWLLGDLLRNMALIIRRFLLLLPVLPLFDPYLLLLQFVIGLYFRWMWKMHFSMVIFSRKSICNHLLATLILRIKFVVFIVLSMALNKLLELGLLSSVMWLLSRVSPLVLMIQLSSFAIHPLVSLSFFFMWMT